MKEFSAIISDIILKHKKIIILFFMLLTIICIVLQFGVKVNYKMEDYLPSNSSSTIALEKMTEEFKSPIYNTKVLIPDVTVSEVNIYLGKLLKVDGVTDVQWMDSKEYYKDGNALIMLKIQEGKELQTIKDIKEVTGEKSALAGEAVNNANSQRMASEEVVKIAAFLIPIIFLILIFATSSFIEPFLFLIAIGVAVAINMGTNIIFGQVSFITYAISPILQLAVSLDYAIFLLSRFGEYRQETDNVKDAMKRAMKKSGKAVFASALTTIFGFLALLAMRFKIGSDLGINLAKGITISLVTVMVFLPALTIVSYKLIDKTKHKRLMPKWNLLSKVIVKVRIPVIILVLLMIIPAFLAQYQNKFSYGLGVLDSKSEAGMDLKEINNTFGRSNTIVLLVPRGDFESELKVTKLIEKTDNVTSVTSLAGMTGAEMYVSLLSEDVVAQFYSENYSRIIINADTEIESKQAFALIKEIKTISEKYYDGKALISGETATLYDLKNVVTADTLWINLLAILAIGLILIFAFKSIVTPIILVMTIETAIWINLSIPYLTGSILCYIGFLVISTVQLGATVDYAILFTDHYNENRKTLEPNEAVIKTARETISSILTSGLILAIAGFTIYFISSEDIVSQLGELFGRGALLSMSMVIFFLPGMLILKDKVFKKKNK